MNKAIIEYYKRRQRRMDERCVDFNEDAGIGFIFGKAKKLGIDTKGMSVDEVFKAVAEAEQSGGNAGGADYDKRKKTREKKESEKNRARKEKSNAKKTKSTDVQVDNYTTSSGASFPAPKDGAKLDSGTLKEVERLAKAGGKERELHKLISGLKSSDYVYMKDPGTGNTIAAVPGISQMIDSEVSGRSKTCQKIYNSKISKGKRITNDMIGTANELGFCLSGLENCYKGGSSVSRKIDTKRNNAKARYKPDKSDGAYVQEFGDVVRYTAMSDHNTRADTVNGIRDKLQKKGYALTECENKWVDGDGTYKAIHLQFQSPDGEKFELQVHSKESMEAKNKSHAYYEEARKLKPSDPKYAEYMAKSKACWDSVPVPKGIEKIKGNK